MHISKKKCNFAVVFDNNIKTKQIIVQLKGFFCMKKMMFIAAIALCAMACGNCSKSSKCEGKCEQKCEQTCEQACTDSTAVEVVEAAAE